MNTLDRFRVKLFPGYIPDKPVKVLWWSGAQIADVQSILNTPEARRLITNCRASLDLS